jgi:hypothetical protein
MKLLLSLVAFNHLPVLHSVAISHAFKSRNIGLSHSPFFAHPNSWPISDLFAPFHSPFVSPRLDTDISISGSADLHGANILTRQLLSGDPVRIADCTFIHVHARTVSGGAISCSANLQVTNSLFDHCVGKIGGAISAHEDVSIVCTTFSRCKATHSGAIDVRSEFDCDVEADFCLFASTEADLFGAMYSATFGGLKIAQANFTRPRAGECVGCMERRHGPFRLEFSILSESVAKVHNGGLCARELSSMRIDSCIFEKCRQSSPDFESAAVFLIYDNPFDSLLANSAFIENDPNESTTLTVVYGHQLLLSGCCFTGSHKKELRDPNGILGGAEFDAESCAGPALFQEGVVGFRPNRTVILFKSRRPRRPPPPRTVGGTAAPVAFAPAAVACAGIAAILTAVQTLLRKAFRDRIKLPLALL